MQRPSLVAQAALLVVLCACGARAQVIRVGAPMKLNATVTVAVAGGGSAPAPAPADPASSAILAALADLRFLVTSVNASLSAEVAVLKAKVDAVDAKVAAVDAKVDAVDAKVDAVDAKVAAVDAKVAAVDAKVTAVNASLSAQVARLDARNADVDATRLSLNRTELAAVSACALDSLLFLDGLECSAFFYQAPSGRLGVVTAGHCVANCSVPAPPDLIAQYGVLGSCAPRRDVDVDLANIMAISRRSGGPQQYNCSVARLFWKYNAASPDVALLTCKELVAVASMGTSAGVAVTADAPAKTVTPLALRRRGEPPAFYTPVAVVGITYDVFDGGVHHYKEGRSMRTLSSYTVASAGGSPTTTASGLSMITTAAGSTVPTRFYQVLGFTESVVPQGMSGGVVVDGACAAVGVAVASSHSGVYASLHAVDEALAATRQL